MAAKKKKVVTKKKVTPKKTIRSSLKQETIKGILTEGAFDMLEWGPTPFQHIQRKGRLKTTKTQCGTVCCIAGHIVAAAVRLKLPIPRGHFYVDDTARAIWAKNYGEEKANKLKFYPLDLLLSIGKNPWNGYRHVTPQDAVEHLHSL